jgi:hypothetical protein
MQKGYVTIGRDRDFLILFFLIDFSTLLLLVVMDLARARRKHNHKKRRVEM